MMIAASDHAAALAAVRVSRLLWRRKLYHRASVRLAFDLELHLVTDVVAHLDLLVDGRERRTSNEAARAVGHVQFG